VDLRGFERAENFPVALRLLPRQVRQDLRAVYDVVRTIDELGDGPAGQVPGGRTAALQDFAADLGGVWSGDRPRTPVLVRLVPVVRRRNLPQDPFDRLVRANLQDQQVTGYRTFEDLLGYCALSAAPIGELVLCVFGAGTAGRRALSERVCAALQVVEHLQDVAEDRRAGRVYLPAEDLAAAGVDLPELDAPSASPQLRRLIAAELVRVEELLDAGAPLVGSLRGWARVAVAGYVAGGRAAVDAVRRTGGDVLGRPAAVRRRDVLRHVAGTLRAARRAAR
jgi:squalene synthase HpnC